MKTNSVNPLKLDKETIAKLDAQQLQEVVGGKKTTDGLDATSGCCHTCKAN